MSMPFVDILYAKLHRVMCTEAKIDYMGSVTIDQNWLDAAGLFEHQKVDVVNLANGERLTTYCIAGERGTGVVCMNGAAAHKVKPGDCLIIIAYVSLPMAEARCYQPQVLLFDLPQEHQYTYDQNSEMIQYQQGFTPAFHVAKHE